MNRLAAWIGNNLIGHLDFDANTGLFSFNYTNEWVSQPLSYPISPFLTFDQSVEPAIHSGTVRRFFENLLPEGDALEAAASTNRLAKSNLFGLIRALGRESTGAISLLPEGEFPDLNQEMLREITTDELSMRIRDRDSIPFNVWDGKVRLSIAGVQDKIAVHMKDGKMYLTQGAGVPSTHIVKPVPKNVNLSSLVANEHFCMKLADAIGLRPAFVDILRVPEPVLLIGRFDRIQSEFGVNRVHVIDSCQALDLSPAYKYERNFGGGRDVKHIKDGVSFNKLFDLSDLSTAPALFRLSVLRWGVYQFLIGNSDAHGKNISFYVTHDGIQPAPAYDLVSVVAYKYFDNDMAMGISDSFKFEDVEAYQWAEFANECGINRTMLIREMKRMATMIEKELKLPLSAIYNSDERDVVEQVRDYIGLQCEKIMKSASLMPDVFLEDDVDLTSSPS